MKKLFVSVGLVMLLVVGLVAFATTRIAFAQEQTPPTQTPQGGPWGWGRQRYGPVEMEAIAKALGMTTEELSNQLWAGRTVADLADKAGVDLTTLRKAVQDAQIAALKDAIKQAVTDGKMTQDKADWLLQGLDKGYWPGGGWGLGCRGGFRGMGKGMFGGMRYSPSTSGTDF